MAKCLKLKPVTTETSKISSAFTELYSKVFTSLYNAKSREFLLDVTQAAKDMRRLKSKIELHKEIAFYGDIKYDKLAVRCSYMYLYCVLDATSVYSEFMKYLQGNESIVTQLFSKKTLKICCLAGGPGNEAVAVCKAISDSIRIPPSENSVSPIDAYVTVVDIYEEWRSEEETIIKALNESKNLFHKKNMRFHAGFLQADIIKPFEENLSEKIKEADIVTVVKFANAFREEAPIGFIQKLETMMKRIVGCMDEDACLFMLDTSGGNSIYKLTPVIAKHPNTVQLQQSLHVDYSLKPKDMQKMEAALDFRKYSRMSTLLLPTRCSKVSSCIWIKKSIQVDPELGKPMSDKTDKEEEPTSSKTKKENSITVETKKEKPKTVKKKKKKSKIENKEKI